MKTRMFVRCLAVLSGLCSSQLVFSGGNLWQVDPANQSIYHPVKWTDQQFPIVWHLSEDGYPGSGIDNAQLTASIETAFNTWASLSGTIAFTNGGVVEENEVGIDGINLLTFTDQDYLFPSGVAAFAINYTFLLETVIDDNFNDIDGDGNRDLPNGTYPPGTVYEADIVYNGSANFTVSGDGTADLEGVTLHEIGHLLGLSHSVILDTVMYPFASQNIASARTLSLDDRAHLSHLYSFDIGFNSTVSGKIINGFSGAPVVGAHVFLFSPVDGKQLVGAFSLANGEYTIPGVTRGYVGIEPLNGNPIAKDPARINEIIEDTFDIDFTTEFYDAGESNTETSALTAQLIDLQIQPGVIAPLTNIDIITNTSAPPGIGVSLRSGLNIFSYPVETLDGFAAFDLLQALGDETEINSMDHYNPASGRYERVYWENGTPTGINFSIKRGEAYLVHMQVEKNVTFEGLQNCPLVQTKAGFNLVGVPCPPASYSAFDLLTTLGGGAVSIKRYNTDTVAFEVAVANVGNASGGIDFPIVNGVGYVIEMLAEQGEVELSGDSQNFPAFISNISPGRAVTGSQVAILGVGFSEDAIANEVLFNGARAAVISASNNMLSVTVPTTATSGSVTVGTGGALSNSIDFVVEPRLLTEADVSGTDIINGQTVQGELAYSSEQDRYTFIATKSSYVTATAIAVNPAAPDLMLFLEGPSGEILAFDDNSAGGNNPQINRFKIARTGRYTVVVTGVESAGAGTYTFSLNLDNVPPIKDITILTGDSQNGLMGAQLTQPLELYITGAQGYPVAGIPITLSTDNDAVTVGNAFSAGSFQFLSNSSGVVVVTITLPNVAGEYQINIHIPGYPVKTLTASALPALPVTVEVTGNGQTCNGTGCTVGQVVSSPYQLRFLDDSGQPVSGVITKFEVVSGEGKLVEGVGVNKQSVNLTSDTNGIVQVSHKLGDFINDANGSKKHQIVAATSNIASAEVVLFEPIVKAANPVNIVSLKTNGLRLTMGTAIINAVNIEVRDAFGNGVPNTPITYTPVGALELMTGSTEGAILPTMQTNAEGVFVGTLQAPFNASPITFLDGLTQQVVGTIRYGETGVAPTIDEFGARIAPPYKLLISAGSVAQPLIMDVDVDMGPNLVIVTQGGGLNINDKQWVGKAFTNQVKMKVVSYQRTDRCSNLINTGAGVTDDDAGDWRDEDFSITGIRSMSYFGIDTTYAVARQDSAIDSELTLTPAIISQPAAASLTVSTEFGVANQTAYLSTDIEPVIVNASNTSGQINVSAVTTPYNRIFEADTVCLFNSGNPAFSGIQYPNGVDIGVQRPLLAQTIIEPLNNFIPLLVRSPTINITLDDFSVVNPEPDVYPGLRSFTGVDITSIKVTLNGVEIFDGTANVATLNTYPKFIELASDGVEITTLENQILGLLTPSNFQITYQPTANELNLSSTNTVVVTQAKDKVGKVLTPVNFQFTMP